MRIPKRISKIKVPTDETLHYLNQALWVWLAENPGDSKEAWPHWNKLLIKPFGPSKLQNCFVCQMSGVSPIRRCKCRAQWADDKSITISCFYHESPFSTWSLIEYNHPDNAPLALKIASITFHKLYSS